MKYPSIFILFVLAIFSYSCSDDMTGVGTQIQPEGDKMFVDTATIHLSTENYYVPYIYSRPDSLLLGKFVDSQYGTTCADILGQLQPPLDFTYPENAVADSAKVILYYYSWFGDKYSPMQVKIYQMDQDSTFSYTKLYKSNIDASHYCSKNELLGSRIFSIRDAVVTRPDTSVITIPLNSDFVQRFSSTMKTTYTDQNLNDFFKFFKGIYITTDFGTASMMYMRTAVMKYYFHYTYQTKAVDGLTDSTATVTGYVAYPMNREVKFVNRFFHPGIETVKQNLNANTNYNYISSPSNIYTRISLPFKTTKSRLNAGSKTLLINRAIIKANIAELNDSTLAEPVPKKVLLIKQSAYDRFFSKRELPSDTCAILSTFSMSVDSITNDTTYYYKFDVAPLLTTELKSENAPDSINFYLVPVSLQYDGNSNVVVVKQQNLMSGVKLYSGSSSKSPMKLDIIYSGL